MTCRNFFQGWEYRAKNDSCCGQCVQLGCILENKVFKGGDTWPGADNCTTFSCLQVLGGVSYTSYVPIYCKQSILDFSERHSDKGRYIPLGTAESE